MHEIAVVEALVEQVVRITPDRAVVIRVALEIGELEHLDEAVMRTAWRAVNDGSPLAGAVLDMTRTPVNLRCRSCRREFQPEHTALFTCPGCGRTRPDIISGTGIVLRTIELDLPDESHAGERSAQGADDEHHGH